MTAVYEVRADLTLTRSSSGVAMRAQSGKVFPLSEEEAWLVNALAEAKGSLAAAATLATTKGLPLSKAKLESLAKALVSRGVLVEGAFGEAAVTVAYSFSANTARAPVQAVAEPGATRTSESLAHTPSGPDARPEPVTVLDATKGAGALSPSDVLPAFRTDLVVRDDKPGRFLVGDPKVGTFIGMADFELSLARLLNGQRTAAEVVRSGERLGLPVTIDTLQAFVQRFSANNFLAPPGLNAKNGRGSTWRRRRKWTTGVRELFRSGMRLLNHGRLADAKPFFKALLEADPQNTGAHEQLKRLGGITAAHASSKPAPTGRSGIEARRSPLKRWMWVAGVAGLMTLGAGMSWAVLTLIAGGPDEPDPLPAVPLPVVVATATVDAGAPSPPPRRSWQSQSATVQYRTLAEVVAPANGRFWPNPPNKRDVTAGKPVGTLRRAAAGLRDAIAGARRVVTELERRNAAGEVEDETVAMAREALNRLLKESNANAPVVASAGGRFVPDVDAVAEVVAGQPVGVIVDPRVWEVKAAFAESPASDAVCAIDLGVDAGTAACALITTRAVGATTNVTAHVSAIEVPWLGAASDVTVRLTPKPAGP